MFAAVTLESVTSAAFTFAVCAAAFVASLARSTVLAVLPRVINRVSRISHPLRVVDGILRRRLPVLPAARAASAVC